MTTASTIDMAHRYLEIARTVALAAAGRLMELRASPLVRQRKADHSLVTNADHEADRIIRDGLQTAFPDHAVLTEESGIVGRGDSEFVWLVDPLDGTKAYAQGTPGFSVMVGLLREGKPFAGVVVDPLEGHCYEAMHGDGAFLTLNGLRRQIHVSSRSDFREMPVITSTGFPKADRLALGASLPGPWLPAINSVGIKVGYLVRQLADIYINNHAVHYWDTCAPQIILEEAGGVMTFLDGSAPHYALKERTYCHENPTLATNGARHRDILRILQAARPK